MGICDVVAFCLLCFISGMMFGACVQAKTDLDKESKK